MTALSWIILIIVAYFFLVFFVLRLLAPFMGFGGYRLPATIPQAVKDKITELENKSTDQLSYLQAAYDFVKSRWRATRGEVVYKFHLIFRDDIEKIWDAPGFAHCTTTNFVLNVLLANSKFFKADDIKVKHQFFNFTPHQYLVVKIGGKWTDADPAGAGIRGKGLGYHAKWFG